MSRYRFELAGPDDDADLRDVLAQTPMAGSISVAFHREPSYFAAPGVEGRFTQVVACRELDTGRIVGFGSRAVRELYVNGTPQPVGYLSSLRLLAGRRNRGLVPRGYAFFRQLHSDGRAMMYLTTIAEGNKPALDVLTSGRAGLPFYHFAGCHQTHAIPLTKKHRPGRNGRSCPSIRPATADDIPAVLKFLEVEGPRRQFFPCCRDSDFHSAGAFQDLRPEDILLAFREGRLIGTLAGWDQHRFRQTVVHGYAGPLRWLRPLHDVWARLRGLPRLPEPGQAFRYLTAALPVVVDNDAEVFAALLDALLQHVTDKPFDYLLLGLHESDPLLALVKTYSAVFYTTRFYHVCWDDGEPLRRSLDGRIPYLELGSL